VDDTLRIAQEKYNKMEESIGTGVSGVVRRGEVAGQCCAVKYFRREVDATHRLREIEVLGSVSHENCLKMVASDERSPPEWVATELMLSKDLNAFTIEPFSESVAAYIVGKVLLALEHLHSKGFAHRDVKPENILLRPDNFEPVVADFGCAGTLG
jgi:serine/threonine protein kinase